MVQAEKLNNIDVDQLLQTIDMIKEQPDLAQFKFRVTNKWIDGTNNQATIQGFYGAGKEDDSREPMRYEMDEPPVLLGGNKGPNPVEYLLVALSGCMTTTMVANAAAKGITINSVSSRFEGDIDLRGFLGISKEVPVGYKEIRVFFDIDADISDEKKQELVGYAEKYSPVYNSLVNATPIRAGIEEKAAV